MKPSKNSLPIPTAIAVVVVLVGGMIAGEACGGGGHQQCKSQPNGTAGSPGTGGGSTDTCTPGTGGSSA